MHLKLAHFLWKQHLRPGDAAIDATCGNGKDTLHLATLLPDGEVIGLDIQESALDQTRALLSKHLLPSQLERIHLFCQSHATFPPLAKPVKLIVYNLGYLPGSDKGITTQTASTLESLQSAFQLLDSKGAISLTSYPGHSEGKQELNQIMHLLSSLSSSEWDVSHYYQLSRPSSPHFFFISKKT